MNPFRVTIRTPDEEILDLTQVRSLTVSTDKGPMIIMSHHASMTAVTAGSPLLIVTDRLEERYMLRRGVVSVNNRRNHVTVLAIACEKLSSMNKQRVSDYLKSIKDMLKKGSLSPRQRQYLRQEELAMDEQLKILTRN